MSETTDNGIGSVCVLCGAPWTPPHKNRCACGGFCTWGKAKDAEPTSWIKIDESYRPRMPGEPKTNE